MKSTHSCDYMTNPMNPNWFFWLFKEGFPLNIHWKFYLCILRPHPHIVIVVGCRPTQRSLWNSFDQISFCSVERCVAVFVCEAILSGNIIIAWRSSINAYIDGHRTWTPTWTNWLFIDSIVLSLKNDRLAFNFVAVTDFWLTILSIYPLSTICMFNMFDRTISV